MGKTMAEKIFSEKSGYDVHAGDIVVAKIDAAMSNDASGPLSIDYFTKMNGKNVITPQKIAFIFDHYVPCPNDKVAKLHQSVFDFSHKFGIPLYDSGEGIAHQVFEEKGYVTPGRLIVGGDSHSTTYGYLNCLGIGIGASDMAMVFQRGELWFKVPSSIRVVLHGTPNKGISGKDVALWIIHTIGTNGANYKSIEFTGEGLSSLTMNDRRTICNMMAECGAKCAVMPFDTVAEKYCIQHNIPFNNIVCMDNDAEYIATVNIYLDKIEHIVACPHGVGNAIIVSELCNQKIDMALIGTCTNGRIDDFRDVYKVIKKVKGQFKIATIVIPASRETYKLMVEEGIVSELLDKGAMILPPSCGPCCGSSPGVPRDNFTVISTANRNFLGRMGNTTAKIYLSSPIVAAASALRGYFTDPKELLSDATS